MVQIRRLPNERNQSLEEVAHYLNITLDMLIGNKGGRVHLLDDDGDLLDIRGGASLGTNEPSLKVRSAAGEHVLVQHSDAVTTLLEVQDDGVTIPLVINSVTFDDAVEFRETVTVRNGTSSTVLAFFDPANKAAIFGRSTALTGAANDMVDFIGGRVYFAASSEDRVIGVRYNTTGGNFFLGATDPTSVGLKFQNSASTQIMRLKDNGEVLVGVATSAAGTELFRVQGGGRFEGGTIVTTGGMTISAGGLTVTAGGLLVSAGGADVSGASTFRASVTVTTGGITVTSGGLTLTAAPLIIGSTVASAGDIRGTKDFTIKARNAANNADIQVAFVDGANNIVFGDVASASTAYLAGGVAAVMYCNGNRVVANPTGLAFNGGTGIAVQTLGAAAATSSAALSLVNTIRSVLIAYTLCN